MKRNINTFFVIIILFTVYGTTSCKKRKLNKSTVTRQSNAIAEMVFNNLLKLLKLQ